MIDLLGYCVKLPNRRVTLLRASDGEGYLLQFKRLGRREDGEDRIVHTELSLSEEGMEALVYIYHNIRKEVRKCD